MEKLKNGGEESLVLDSTALQLQKHDTLLRLRQAKESVKVLLNLSTDRTGRLAKVVVSIKSSGEMRGKSRMLSEAELQELIDSKQIVANETRHIIHHTNSNEF